MVSEAVPSIMVQRWSCGSRIADKKKKISRFSSSNQKPTLTKSNRSSHQEVFCKKVVLTNFSKFAGKHLCQGLFFIKKRLRHRGFSVNLVKFLRTLFFYRTPLVAASNPTLTKSSFSGASLSEKMYSKSCETSKKKLVAKVVNGRLLVVKSWLSELLMELLR